MRSSSSSSICPFLTALFVSNSLSCFDKDSAWRLCTRERCVVFKLRSHDKGSDKAQRAHTEG